MPVTDTPTRYAPLVLLFLLAGVWAVLTYRYSKRRVRMRGGPRSWADYILLWPLIFEASSSVDRSRRLLTNRELLGWLIVAILIAVGVTYF